MEKSKQLFHSRLDLPGWKKSAAELYAVFCGEGKGKADYYMCSPFTIFEETYLFTTSLYSVCSRKRNCRVFILEADTITGLTRAKLHHSVTYMKYSVNY